MTGSYPSRGDTEYSVVQALRNQPASDLYTFLINDGKGWISSRREASLANGESIYVYVNNPTTDTNYDVVLLPRSTGLADFDVSFNATPNDLTAAGLNNLKSSAAGTFSGDVLDGVSTSLTTNPTHGTAFLEDFIPGSGAGANVAGQVADAIAFTVDAGDDKLVELRNQSGGSVSRIGLTTGVFEIDSTYKDV